MSCTCSLSSSEWFLASSNFLCRSSINCDSFFISESTLDLVARIDSFSVPSLANASVDLLKSSMASFTVFIKFSTALFAESFNFASEFIRSFNFVNDSLKQKIKLD